MLRNKISCYTLALFAYAVLCNPLAAQETAKTKVQFELNPTKDQGKLGEVLPIPRPTYKPITEQDWRNVEPPERFDVKPPEGAPLFCSRCLLLPETFKSLAREQNNSANLTGHPCNSEELNSYASK